MDPGGPFGSWATVMGLALDCILVEEQPMASKQAIDSFLSCRRIAVVDVECPFMFLPGSGRFHGVHRFFRSLSGHLPS